MSDFHHDLLEFIGIALLAAALAAVLGFGGGYLTYKLTMPVLQQAVRPVPRGM